MNYSSPTRQGSINYSTDASMNHDCCLIGPYHNHRHYDSWFLDASVTYNSQFLDMSGYYKGLFFNYVIFFRGLETPPPPIPHNLYPITCQGRIIAGSTDCAGGILSQRIKYIFKDSLNITILSLEFELFFYLH